MLRRARQLRDGVNRHRGPMIGGFAAGHMPIGGGAFAGTPSGALGNRSAVARNYSATMPAMPPLGITMRQIRVRLKGR